MIDLGLFLILSLMTYLRISCSVHPDDEDKIKGWMPGLFIASILSTIINTFLLQYAWGLSVSHWLGNITLTQSIGLLIVGLLIVPYSISQRRIKGFKK